MTVRETKRAFIAAVLLLTLAALPACGLFGPRDETAAAAALVQEANDDLRKIKEIYDENEGDVDKPGKRDFKAEKTLLPAMPEQRNFWS